MRYCLARPTATRFMKLTSIDVIGELERLAAACPWEGVEITIRRKPEGIYDFVVYLSTSEQYGFHSLWTSGPTPGEAVANAIKQSGDRTPHEARKKAIAELKEKIAKLEAVVIGLPPYRPNRELSNGEPAIQAQPTINV